MIKFEKVSLKEYTDAVNKYDNIGFTEDELREEWGNIKLPKRSTKCSAGYDFFAPQDFSLPGRTINALQSCVYSDYGYKTFPTGIRFVTDEPDVVLLLIPRSGLGFKYGTRLRNSIGCIDADYFLSDNEGHIMVKMCAEVPVEIEQGKAYMQGIITRYLTVDDDNTHQERNGGLGSTDK